MNGEKKKGFFDGTKRECLISCHEANKRNSSSPEMESGSNFQISRKKGSHFSKRKNFYKIL